MADFTPSSNDERRKHERKVWRAGLWVSLLIHVLIFALWPVTRIHLSPFAAAGPRANDALAASGSAMHAINMRIATEVAPVVVPKPDPVPIEVEIEPVVIEQQPVVEVVAAGVGQGVEGPGRTEGPGTTDGRGAGDGGTGDEGRFRLNPPTPRGMILPPTNQRLRGREVEVWVFVDIRGRVVADSTHLKPPTPDGNFNRLLIREAAEWVFRPATQGGQPVATWFPYKILM